MSKNKRQDLLQGTLDMLILRTLALGTFHGYSIAKHIQRTSDEVLHVETGSLYPALRRLEQRGWIRSWWDMSEQHNRELKFYELTAVGRKQLTAEQSRWEQLVRAIAGVMKAEEVK
jgi:transcriptional regulator